MTAIRKVLISAFGDPSNVSVVSDTLPPPPAGHAQIRVLYSGFNGADINMRLGCYPFQRKAPLTPGYCFVGTITALPPSSPSPSTEFKTGDTVACLSVYDAESTYLNMPLAHLVPVPSPLSSSSTKLAETTALILDWSTAYGMVHRYPANIYPGARVFIHGCSGAVGYALLALCKLRGATDVHGTCSAANFAAVRALGATPHAYTDKEWIPALRALGGADAVFDPLGFESWDESYSILSPKGRLLGYGGNLNTLKKQAGGGGFAVWPTLKLLVKNLYFWSGRATTFYYIDRGQKTFVPDLEALFALWGEGKIDVRIKKVWALDDVREAHERFNSVGGIGSFLIKVGEEEGSTGSERRVGGSGRSSGGKGGSFRAKGREGRKERRGGGEGWGAHEQFNPVAGVGVF